MAQHFIITLEDSWAAADTLADALRAGVQLTRERPWSGNQGDRPSPTITGPLPGPACDATGGTG